MNDEQITPGENTNKEDQDAGKVFLTPDSTLQGENEFSQDKGNKDYYAVDDPKKEVTSTIGDGEMRNEGMVGSGNIAALENPFTSEAQNDDQDLAEARDTES